MNKGTTEQDEHITQVQFDIGKPTLNKCQYCLSNNGLTFPVRAVFILSDNGIVVFCHVAHLRCFASSFKKYFPNTSIARYRNKKNRYLEMSETTLRCICNKYLKIDVEKDINMLVLCIEVIGLPTELQKMVMYYLGLPVGVIATDSDKEKSQACDEKMKHRGMPSEVVDIILQFACIPRIIKPECLHGSLVNIILGVL